MPIVLWHKETSYVKKVWFVYWKLFVVFFYFSKCFTVQYENILEAFKNAFLFAGAISLLAFILTFYVQNIKSRILKDERLKTQEALGEGDIPIIAIIGIILGIKAGLVAIFLASLFAIIPSIYSNIKNSETQLPFIPFLSLGLICEYIFQISKVFLWNLNNIYIQI